MSRFMKTDDADDIVINSIICITFGLSLLLSLTKSGFTIKKLATHFDYKHRARYISLQQGGHNHQQLMNKRIYPSRVHQWQWIVIVIYMIYVHLHIEKKTSLIRNVN